MMSSIFLSSEPDSVEWFRRSTNFRSLRFIPTSMTNSENTKFRFRTVNGLVGNITGKAHKKSMGKSMGFRRFPTDLPMGPTDPRPDGSWRASRLRWTEPLGDRKNLEIFRKWKINQQWWNMGMLKMEDLTYLTIYIMIFNHQTWWFPMKNNQV
jgi:hypothetical protein